MSLLNSVPKFTGSFLPVWVAVLHIPCLLHVPWDAHAKQLST